MREKRFNLAHRLIHWAIALTMSFLLLTVFLRIGWMNKDFMGGIIQQNLNKSGVQINTKDAALIGKAVRKPMWRWHEVAGYVMIGLYLIRMLITAMQGIAYKGPFSKESSSKDKFKAWVYIVFYVLLAASLFTGFMVENGPKSLQHNMAEVHMQSIYYVVIFIMLHIGGVLIADAGLDRGLISKMISGDKA
ncbi:MAG: cytochrome b/b6 domain-containing protein [Mucilaginibacter sp.]|uniref:cytochrome b/b6 domain-containing protein n=1 Tax=Mucilaginibacter sp. TaxID=1882438 RepID=UPI0031A85645